MIRRLGSALTLVLAAAVPAAAQGTCAIGMTGELLEGRNTGLSGSVSTINFEGLGLASGSAVTAPFTQGGVTINLQGAFAGSGILYFPSSGFAMYNYGGGAIANPEVAMTFNGPTRAAAFQFATDAGKATFKAWNGASLVGTIAATFPRIDNLSNACWWGFDFTSTTFDRLTIIMKPDDGSTLAFGFDNLQVPIVSTVPESSTVGLLAVGLLGLGASARRRRKR
ncbi:MAG: PEP-CTERM sorting domain-containing protein [Gemmatimonadaceae bacterium]|nr:PEP-CTERM sorting domain-containing protein [Gemmatimonadaceae bacterium]